MTWMGDNSGASRPALGTEKAFAWKSKRLQASRLSWRGGHGRDRDKLVYDMRNTLYL